MSDTCSCSTHQSRITGQVARSGSLLHADTPLPQGCILIGKPSPWPNGTGSTSSRGSPGRSPYFYFQCARTYEGIASAAPQTSRQACIICLQASTGHGAAVPKLPVHASDLRHSRTSLHHIFLDPALQVSKYMDPKDSKHIREK